MKKVYQYYLILLVIAVSSAGVVMNCLLGEREVIGECRSVSRPARIHPDYSGTVVPPNIAPLNFLVQEEGSQYCVKIHSTSGEAIEVFSRAAKITIPAKRWRKLLNANRGKELYFDVFVKTQDGRWDHFSAITNKIADEDIDDFLVYRIHHPSTHLINGRIGVYQRNLRGFDESVILDNSFYERGCLNCHTFCRNRTDKMLIDIRGEKYGSSTLLIEDSIVKKIGARFTYNSWHPSGRLVVYSLNTIRQFFHTAREEIRSTVDMDSLILYYLVDSSVVKTSPKLSQKERLETYPAWSADGRYLYFCSAPMLWTDQNEVPPKRYKEVKYDLMRISYDIENDQWGELETVLSAKDTGLSILMPRISPDGRWLLFCMCDYGSFPAFEQSSDLYIMDLEAAQKTGQYKYRRLDINSDRSESWHCWSSNGRWLAFSSKRDFGVFSRIYFSYVDEAGEVYKPIILPQKDPTFYDSFLQTCNTPELVIEPVRVTKEKLGRVVRGRRQIEVSLPITMATPRAKPAPEQEYLSDERE
jgi:hypothetical protein